MLMGNNSREDIMDLDLNQEPLDQSYDSVIGLDSILNDLETAHGRIEERIRQLEAVTTRATRRQRWRRIPTSVESADTSAEHAVAVAHLGRHSTGDDSVAAQEGTAHLGKTSKKDGSQLVAKALAMDAEPKTTGNKIGSFFDCNICLDVAKDPILTCCGHLFCWSCFYQLSYVHSNAKECPACQGEVTDTSIIPIYGHGNNGRKPNLFDSGFMVPPRPRAQRIESMRQQILFRGTSSSLIEERIQQISNMIGAMGEQSRSQNLDVTHGGTRIERSNLPGRRRRASQVLPATESDSNPQSRPLQVSRLLLQGAASFSTLSSALNSAMDSAERLVEDLESYIHNQSASRSRPHSLTDNPNNVDPLSGITATIRTDIMTPDPPIGITYLIPQYESSSRSVDIATNIEPIENQSSNAAEFNRTILPSSSTRRRSEVPNRSDMDNEILQQPRRRRLG